MQLRLGPCSLLGRKSMEKQPYAGKDTWSPLHTSFETASLNRLAFRAHWLGLAVEPCKAWVKLR